MNRPLKPRKPLKSAIIPRESEIIIKVVMVDENKNIVLLTRERLEEVNEQEQAMQYELNCYDNFGERIRYSDILKFKKILPSDIDDFNFYNYANCDGYYEYTVVEYEQKKPEDQYRRELEDFNNRFKKYEIELLEWEKKNDEYLNWAREQKKIKLTQELSKL